MSREGKRRIRASWASAICVSLAAITLAVSPIGGGSALAQDGERSNILIGVIAPLTGPGAVWGVPQANGFRVAAEQANRAGGLRVGDKTYTIQVIARDPQFDPAGTKQIINDMVFNEGIDFVVTNGDPIDPIVVPVSEERKMIHLDNTANATFIGPDYNYVLNGYASPHWASLPYFKGLLELEPQIRRVHYFGIDAQFDRNHLQWTKDAATSLGLEDNGTTFYEFGTVDFASVLTPIVASNPDMVALGVPSGDTPAVVRTLRQLGYEGVVGSPIALADISKFVDAAGAVMDGYYQADSVQYPHTNAYVDFVNEYQSYGVEPNSTAGGYWIFAQVFLEALRQAGTVTDPNAIMEAFKIVRVEDPFIDNAPDARMGGAETYGTVRQLVLPLVLNKVEGGEVVTKAVLPVDVP